MLRNFYNSGTGIFLPEDEVALRSPGGVRKVLVGGFFCMRHKLTHDRLTYDRRPRNTTEKQFKWARLPYVGCDVHPAAA